MKHSETPASRALNAPRPAGEESTTVPRDGQFSVTTTPAQLVGYAQTALLDLVDHVVGWVMVHPAYQRDGFDLHVRAINRFLVAARDRLELPDSQILPEPQRLARELIDSLGRPSAVKLRDALMLELHALETPKTFRLGTPPAELEDSDRRQADGGQ